LQEFNIEMHADLKQADFLAPSSFSTFHDMIPTFMLRRFVLLCLLAGIRYSLFLLASIGVSLHLLWETLSELGLLPSFHKLTALLRHVFLWIPKTILRQFDDFNTPNWADGPVDLATKFCPCLELCSFVPCSSRIFI